MSNEQIQSEWFGDGVDWGDDTTLIHDALGLWAYQNHQIMSRDHKLSGSTTLIYRCTLAGCPAEIRFLLYEQTRTWRIKFNKPHSDECRLKSTSDQNFIFNLWKGRKLETLVSVKFLATLVLPYLRQISPSSLHDPRSADVKKILIQRGLVPPFYSDHPQSDLWLRRLASRIKKIIESRELDQDLPTIEQLIQINNKFDGTELLFLEAFARTYRALLPENEVIINIDPQTKKYQNCYVVVGIVKKMATHPSSTYQINIDGSHFKHPKRSLKCPGSFRAVLYSDANGSIYPLILIHETKEESIDTWEPIVELLIKLFPNPSKLAIGSDRDKGLSNVLDKLETQHKFTNVFCHFHIKQNIKSHFKVKDQQKLAVNLFEKLASARTIKYFEKLKGKLKTQFPALSDYLEPIDPKFWAVSHFPPNRIDITSNPAESYWSALLHRGIREMIHIPSIFIACHGYVISKLETDLLDMQDWKNPVSKIAVRKIQENNEASKKMTVITVTSNLGTVLEEFGDRYEADIQQRTCTCTKDPKKSFFCSHLLALSRSKNLNQAFNLFAPSNYWHVSWLQGMNHSKPWTRFTFDFSNEEAKNSFEPPVYGALRGRPKNDRDERKKMKRLSKSKTGASVFKDPNFQGGKQFSLNLENISDLDPEAVYNLFFEGSAPIEPTVIPTDTLPPGPSEDATGRFALPDLLDDSKILQLITFRSLQDNSAIESQRERIRQRLQHYGLEDRLVEVPGDGNCFFTSIGLLAGQSHQQVRADLVGWLRANENILGEPLSSFTDAENWEVYCDRMSQDKSWADHLVLLAAAEFYKRELIIISSAPGDQHVIPIRPSSMPAAAANPFILVHWQERHYDPITQNETLFPSNSPAVDHPRDTRILAEFKLPSSRCIFPLIATDLNKEPLKLTCNSCGDEIPIVWNSSKGYDLAAFCQNCQLRFVKHGRAISKQGMHEITFLITTSEPSALISNRNTSEQSDVSAEQSEVSVEQSEDSAALELPEGIVDILNDDPIEEVRCQVTGDQGVCSGTDHSSSRSKKCRYFKPRASSKRLHIDTHPFSSHRPSSKRIRPPLDRASRDKANKRLEKKTE